MRLIQQSNYTCRTLTFGDLPESHIQEHDRLGTITISLSYVEQPNEGMRLHKAVMLDGTIMPLLRRAAAMDHALREIVNARSGTSKFAYGRLIVRLKEIAAEALKTIDPVIEETLNEKEG